MFPIVSGVAMNQAAAVSYANPVATLSLVNHGPTVGGAGGGSFNTNNVAMIAIGNPNIAANAGHTIEMQIGFSVATGLTIATSEIKSIVQGAGTSNLISDSLYVGQNPTRHASDAQAWANDPNPSAGVVGLTPVTFQNGGQADVTIDSLATIQASVAHQGSIFIQFQETVNGVNGNSGHNPGAGPQLSAGDVVIFTHAVTDSNGGIHNITAQLTLV